VVGAAQNHLWSESGRLRGGEGVEPFVGLEGNDTCERCSGFKAPRKRVAAPAMSAADRRSAAIASPRCVRTAPKTAAGNRE
jgi:hypothetical protein